MDSTVEKWIEETAKKSLYVIGIRKGQKVLDFGCGPGHYTIPVARLVSEKGVVYALDEDKGILDQLMKETKSMGLGNVRRLDSLDKARIRLSSESVDVVLLYDVLHYYYFPKEKDRRQLLSEVYRVLKYNGLLSVHPTHLESHMEPKLDDVKKEIEGSKLHEEREYNGLILVHDNRIEEGMVINFRKGKAITG